MMFEESYKLLEKLFNNNYYIDLVSMIVIRK